MRVIIPGFVLILAISSVYGQNGTVKGRVRGPDGGLQAATVRSGEKSALTDVSGEFSFSLSPGDHVIVITYVGYKKIEQKVTVTADSAHIIDFVMTPSVQMGEVVVLGTRLTTPRNNLNTPVSVDVLTSSQLRQTGQFNLPQMLNFTAPSVNASRQLLNEPITLRGLNPDQVLILLNGTRYHNMAYIKADEIRGQLGKGSVSNDLNTIPFSAIEKIEILRDGASAQYGSDAIAGVMNIQLKRSTGTTSVQLHTGQYYEGDGENIALGIYHGIVLNKKRLLAGRQGFLNFSGDLRYRDRTFRGGEYKGRVYDINPIIDDSMVRARNFDRNVSNAGNSKLSSFGILMNGGYPVHMNTEIFWTVAVNSRESSFMAPYIFPILKTLLNPDLFPDGARTSGIQNSYDVSGIAGAKGKTKKEWHWEYSSSYGGNRCVYNPEHTNNASQYYTLGKNAPTEFYTGTQVYRQLANNISFSKELSKKPRGIKLFNLSLGAEWRLENYQIKAGEEAGWKNYDPLERKLGGVRNALIFRPEDEVNKNRNVLAAYIDLETEVNDQFLFDIASRYEYYSDFGGNLAGKIAIRYKISDEFSLRGSVGNGFRAPSLQQRYYSATLESVRYSYGQPRPVTTRIFNNQSVVAEAFGIPLLQAEKSLSFSGGFSSTLINKISLSVNAYWIQITDRIAESGIFDESIPGVDSLLPSGIDEVQFFANAINTRTYGLDISLNGNWQIKRSNLAVMLAANFNQTKQFGETRTAGNLKADSLNTNAFFNRLERTRLEKGQPRDKIILSLDYKTGRFGFLLRNTYFGETAIVNFFWPDSTALDEFFSPRLLTDISISYSPKTWFTVTAGANNVFNVYPDPLKHYANTGDGMFIYSMESSPFGFNGGYYYVSMAFTW